MHRSLFWTTVCLLCAAALAANDAAAQSLPRLKVSENHRFLVKEDGTPFFWLGDTVWELFQRPNREEVNLYLETRASQQFTVVQAVALGEICGASASNAEGQLPLKDNDPAQPNEAYFARVDYVVNKAESLRLTIHPEMIVNLYSQTPANSGTLGFYDKSYVNFAGFEVSNGWLASCHKGSREYGEPWKPYSAPRSSCAAIDMPLGLYHRTPTKPIINLEVVYDCKSLQEHNAKYWAQPYPLRMTRSGGYLSMLSGAKGLTYGCGGVCYWGYQKNEAIGGGWTPLEPDDGLYKPSSDQMTYFFEVFSSREWWRLEPAHELVLNQPAAPTTVDDPAWLTRMVMAKTHNGDLGVAYLPDNDHVQVNMSAFPTAMQAHWFNPATGKYEAISGAIPAERSHTFARPSGWDDAVLIVAAN